MQLHGSKVRLVASLAVFILVVFALSSWKNLKDIQIISKITAGSIANIGSAGKGGSLTYNKEGCNCDPIPADGVLRTMNREQVAQHYHNYVNSIQMSCKKIIRHGNIGDGGWDVCVDPPYNIQKPCVVYSFGINYDWSFDDSVAMKYGCEVHAYDPSMRRVTDHNRKPNLHFHRTGLNTSDGVNHLGWRMRTFKSILKENGHSETTVDLLKIDIDYSEWWAFPEMLKSGALKNVKQFCFEIHVKLNSHPEPSFEKYLVGLNLLRDFYDAGYRIFRTHKNMDARYRSVFGVQRTGCHEIYMVKNNTRTYG